MALSYEWQIETIETAKAEGDLNDVAKAVHWRLNAVDGEYTATAYGSVVLDDPTPSSFVAFDALERGTVVGWVQDKLDEAVVRAALAQRIADDRDPPVVQKLPASW